MRGARILLAEDHDPLRQLLRELLEAEGCKVEVCHDGRAALARIEGPSITTCCFSKTTCRA